MATCWNCNRRFNVPEDDSAEEHGCPRCGVMPDDEDVTLDESEDDDGDG